MSSIISNIQVFSGMSDAERLAREPCRLSGIGYGNQDCPCKTCEARRSVEAESMAFAGNFASDALASGMTRDEFVKESDRVLGKCKRSIKPV